MSPISKPCCRRVRASAARGRRREANEAGTLASARRFAVGAKIAAFLGQYVVFRTMVRRRLTGERPSGGMVMRSSSTLLSTVAGLILFGTSSGADAAGFRQLAVPDPEGEPLELAVWYPSDAPAEPHRLGPFRQTVAIDGRV